MSNLDRIGNEVYCLAQIIFINGIDIDDAVKELRLAYAERLEEQARCARGTLNGF